MKILKSRLVQIIQEEIGNAIRVQLNKEGKREGATSKSGTHDDEEIDPVVEPHTDYMGQPGGKKMYEEEKDKNWIQDAEKDIDRRGTEGVCTGDKFGSESCPPGSKRYNLAKTFKKMAKDRKKK